MQGSADRVGRPRLWVDVLAIGLVFLLAGGCRQIADMDLGEFSDRGPELSDMTGTNWRAIDVANYGHASAADSSISFNQDDQLSGKTGCNTFLGPYRLNDSRVTFGPFAMTRMMCEPEIALQEDAFLEALARAATAKIAGKTMTLFDGSGNVVMSLVLIE